MAIQLDISELSLISSKLPDKDLCRFLLKWGYEQKDLDGLRKDALLQLTWQVWDAWEAKYKQEDYLRLVARSMCQTSFEFFVRMFWDEVPLARSLLWNWHMSYLCQELQEIAEYIGRGETPPYHLIINISPGTSKSSICSILFHCWVWCIQPGAGFITASHTHSLVLDLAARTRDALKGELYNYVFPEIVFSESQDAKGHFRNTIGGERFVCTASGASPVGKHANYLICDDILNPEKALTEDGRKNVEEFITRSASTRRVRGKGQDLFVIILVMQRLGVGDATDVMLRIAHEPNARPVRHVCLPAELTDNVSPPELRRYYEGINTDGECQSQGLMDPIRLSKRVLQEQLSILGSWAYTGQFLQAPRPISGGMFKTHFFNNRLRAAPYNCKRIRYWDRAASRETSACATAGVLMAYDGEKFYVEDVAYGRWEPDERNAEMLATAQKDRARYGKHEPVIYVEHEGGSTGKESFLYLVRLLARNGFTRVRQDIVTGKGGKDTRAEPWADQLAAGNVFLIDNGEKDQAGRAGWDINGYIEDHLSFRPTPNSKLGREKDRVDASCLIAGTLVETEDGSIKIEEVGVGTKVLTRNGYREVVWSGCSGKTDTLTSVLFSNGSVLTGTSEHLVWTLGRGYIKLAELTENDYVLQVPGESQLCLEKRHRKPAPSVKTSSLQPQLKHVLKSVLTSIDGIIEEENTSTSISNLMASNTEDNCQTAPILQEEEGSLYIETFGSSITAQFPVAITSITRTKTRWTTELKILNVSLLKNMLQSTQDEARKSGDQNIWQILEKKLLSGTQQKREEHGIESTQRQRSRDASQKNTFVRYAKKSSRPLLIQNTELNSALLDVPIDNGVSWERERKRKFASNVAEYSWVDVKRYFVDTPVPQPGSGPIEVYDLTVDGEHEFFANGILVHNSGAFNLFVGKHRAYPVLQTYNLAPSKDNKLRFVVCTQEELDEIQIDEHTHCVVITIDEPDTLPQISQLTYHGAMGNNPVKKEEEDLPLPEYCSVRSVGALQLKFADLDSAALQESWDKPVEPYGQLPEYLVLQREAARKLWQFLLKKRDIPWGICILVDLGDNDNRALSVAAGLADGYRLPRSVVYRPSEPDTLCAEKPPNNYIFEQVKACRNLVIT